MALENLELRSKVITDLINEFLEKGQVEVADKLKAISDLDYMKYLAKEIKDSTQ
jgi:hypothetical protein